MPHITLSKKAASKPSLEFYTDGNGDARRVTIEQCPFRIGRSETADLRIDAVEVSRDHAEIVERNGIWLVRDLGSTNGTQVNGKPIKETLLADGDILKVAETELSFVASPASQFQRMVTQPIQSKKPATAASVVPPEIAAARALIEATLWQAIPTQLLAATSLREGSTEALFAPQLSSVMQHRLADQPHTVAEHLRTVERMKAIELATEQPEPTRLFLAVSAAEIETPQRLLSSLNQLQDRLPGGRELGITISMPIDVDILRITDAYRQARDHGLPIAFDEFQGNGGQVMHLESLLPDYLLLAPSMTKELVSTRQPLRRLESLLAACQELLIKPVLPPTGAGHIVALCQEIGFDLILRPTSNQAHSPAEELCATV